MCDILKPVLGQTSAGVLCVELSSVLIKTHKKKPRENNKNNWRSKKHHLWEKIKIIAYSLTKLRVYMMYQMPWRLLLPVSTEISLLSPLHCSTGDEAWLWKIFVTPRLVQHWNVVLSEAVLWFTIGSFEKELQDQLISILLILLHYSGHLFSV